MHCSKDFLTTVLAVDPYNEYVDHFASRLRSKVEISDIEATLSWLQNAPENILSGIEEAFKEYESGRHCIISDTINVCYSLFRFVHPEPES